MELKPANIYQYLPRNSCHRKHTFMGLMIGEALRIHRRCLHKADADKHLRFFQIHLLKRGYNLFEFSKCLRIAAVRAARPFDTASSSVPRTRKAFIKVTHSSTVNYAALGRIVSKNAHLVNSKLIVSSRAQKNIFRLLYKHNWC